MKYYNGNNYKLHGKEELIIQLNRQGLSDVEIAERLNVVASAIHWRRQRLKLSSVKQYNYSTNEDPDFPFDVYNPKELMATEFGQVLIGTLLGDGCIPKNSNSEYLYLAHSIEQEKYLDYKIKKLGFLDFKKSCRKARDNSLVKNAKPKVVTYSRVHPFLKYLRKIFYPNGKKKINTDFLKLLDIRGFLIWFWDDGSFVLGKNNYNCFQVTLAMCGYSEKEKTIVSDMMKSKFNLNNITLTKQGELRVWKQDGIKFCKLAVQNGLPKGILNKTEKVKYIANSKKKKK